MGNYIGETVVHIDETRYKGYSKNDWALHYIYRYGQIDGSHHKQWVLDQVARILHGNEIIIKLAKWDDGHEEYRIDLVDEPTQDYVKWVKDYTNEDANDPDQYWSYDEGIAP